MKGSSALIAAVTVSMAATAHASTLNFAYPLGENNFPVGADTLAARVEPGMSVDLTFGHEAGFNWADDHGVFYSGDQAALDWEQLTEHPDSGAPFANSSVAVGNGSAMFDTNTVFYHTLELDGWTPGESFVVDLALFHQSFLLDVRTAEFAFDEAGELVQFQPIAGGWYDDYGNFSNFGPAEWQPSIDEIYEMAVIPLPAPVFMGLAGLAGVAGLRRRSIAGATDG